MNEAEERGEQRDEQRDLERDRPRLGVDLDDLGLDVGGLPASSCVEVRVRHHLGVLLEPLRDLLLLGRREHLALIRRSA